MKKTESKPSMENELTIEPLTSKNWGKFVQLFGNNGACGNCWCMYYRLPKSEFKEGKTGDGNKNAMKDIVWGKRPAGILGLIEGEAVGWCAFAPREDFLKLKKSRVHKPIDDESVWSIPCFFIGKNYRRAGISVEMLKGIIKYAGKNGIKIIEAYPAIPGKENLPDSFLWTGLYKSFERAGFSIADRTSVNRPMVRYYVSPADSPAAVSQ